MKDTEVKIEQPIVPPEVVLAEGPLKPARKVYVGEPLVLSTVKPFEEVLIPCQSLTVEMPENIDKFTGTGLNYGVKRMPNLIIVTQVSQYDKSNLLVRFKDYQKKFVDSQLFLPLGTSLNRLIGRQGADMLRKLEEHKMANIHYELGKFGMTIGSDPEVFVVDKDNQVVPAFDFLGSKTKPTNGENDSGNHGGKPVYWDGFQAEFETVVGTCLGWQTDSVHLGLKTVYREAQKHKKTNRLTLASTLPVSPQVLKECKPEHVALGCAPSLNIYQMKGRDVTDGTQLPFRFAGGHIHFGIAQHLKTKESIVEVVKALDAIVGVACVSLFHNIDNPVRRQYYGLAGEYRLPAHGLEYRTLSNGWLSHPLIMNLVFDMARKVVNLGLLGYRKLWIADEVDVINCINNCDVEKARAILTRNKALFKTIFKACYGSTDSHLDALHNIFMTGMETIIDKSQDIEGNWHLAKGWISHSGFKGCSHYSATTAIDAKTKV